MAAPPKVQRKVSKYVFWFLLGVCVIAAWVEAC